MELDEYIDIVRKEITPSNDEELIGKIFKWYLDRTRTHIASVVEIGGRAVELLKDMDWCCLLKTNLVSHDSDKLDDGLFIAHYAPYIVKKYCQSGLQEQFSLTDEYAIQWDHMYVVQHCLKNGHHPEHWDQTYWFGENHPPYNDFSMPPEYVAEMCCDWCAVAKEQGNSAMAWFDTVNGRWFLFSSWQQNLIQWLLSRLDGSSPS